MKLKQFEDFQLYVREKDWGFWQNNEYEPEETKLIKSLVKKDDVCLDIGANIGYFTVLMGKRCKEVWAFEPEPNNSELLWQNLVLNNIENAWVVDHAVTDEHARVSNLYLCETSHGMHRMYKSKHCGKPIKVPTCTIDGGGFDKVDFIKMDIEGSESSALMGMRNLLERDHPTILMEFHPPSIIEYGSNPELLYLRIKELNYDIRLVPNIHQTISYQDLYQETMKEPSGRNILCQYASK